MPSYPEEARKNGWGGVGVFRLHFKGDGVVGRVDVLISTEHQLLDETAKTTLAQWQCQPRALGVATITMTFRTNKSEKVVALKSESEAKQRNLVYAPRVFYPYEARRQRVAGSGIFMLHFRPDGTVDKVVPVRSTGSPLLDGECLSTFSRWRCHPGVYTVVQVPIAFTLAGRR